MDLLTRPRAFVRPATPADWPAIEAMRDGYFARVGRPVQVRALDALSWLVCERDGIVSACLSYDDGDARWGRDAYCTPTRAGHAAFMVLVNRFRDDSDAAGQDVYFYTDPRNRQYNEAVRKRGDFALIGLLWYRRKPSCQAE